MVVLNVLHSLSDQLNQLVLSDNEIVVQVWVFDKFLFVESLSLEIVKWTKPE